MPRPPIPTRTIRSSQHLLDFLYLASASRKVASNHAQLRARQWAKYRKSSAPAREVEEQLKLVSQGLGAAIALARRFLEDAPQWRQESTQESVKPVVRIFGNEEPKIQPTEVVSASPEPVKTEPATIEEEIPPSVDLNVFRSKRTARMLAPDTKLGKEPNLLEEELRKMSANGAEPPSTTSIPEPEPEADPPSDLSPESGFKMRESRVPATRFGRFWQYTGLATSMAFGAMGESLRRATGSSSEGSLMLSPQNMERLVAKLSRMRGAALKLGQMMSFQDSKAMPPIINEILQRVQDSADYMPASQRDQVLSDNLGSNWRELFSRFDDVPIAAASIGQVHRAVYKATGQEVAVKVQYPGVARSIDSDLNNLSVLLTASRILPRGLFLDRTIDNARTELGWECDYEREAAAATRFSSLLKGDDAFAVPTIFPEASGKQVLTAEFMRGVGVTKMPHLSQEHRDWIGSQILRLCLREITEFAYMQTDPNWTNFMFNPTNHKIELLDFGASREYPPKFIDPYIGVLRAASKGDSDTIAALSIDLGYLTGSESTAMRDAHVKSVLTLAEPFGDSAPEVYDFKDQTITDRVRSLIPTMLKERLAPPPEETYSLHRKLSGAFLLCARLGSSVRCREMFEASMKKYDEKRTTTVL